MGLPKIELSTVQTSYHPPGLSDQQDTSGDVPGVYVVCPERVKGSAGEIGKVQGTRTGPANSLAPLGNLQKVDQIGRCVGDLRRKADRNQTAV